MNKENEILYERLSRIIFDKEFNSSLFIKNFKDGKNILNNLTYFENIKKNHLRIDHKEIIDNCKKDCRKQKIFNDLKKGSLSFLNIYDPDYPSLLKEIFYPPPFLFYKGKKIKEIKNLFIAIVGTRNCTKYGEDAACCFSTELSKIGFTVVSGMATGIDAAVHKCALREKGGTIGVLGTGIDIFYPAANLKLYDKILENGSLVTEFFPGTPPLKQNFPARNRIISGMSMAVIVIEAAEKSGAIITAQSALRENREVFAVPGSIFSSLSSGCHNLIKQGAILIDKIDDVIDNLSHYAEEFKKNKLFSEIKYHENGFHEKTITKEDQELEAKKIISRNLSGTQAEECLKVYRCIDSKGASIEHIMLKTGLNINNILKILSFLEINDMILEKSYNCYSIKN